MLAQLNRYSAFLALTVLFPNFCTLVYLSIPSHFAVHASTHSYSVTMHPEMHRSRRTPAGSCRPTITGRARAEALCAHFLNIGNI